MATGTSSPSGKGKQIKRLTPKQQDELSSLLRIYVKTKKHISDFTKENKEQKERIKEYIYKCGEKITNDDSTAYYLEMDDFIARIQKRETIVIKDNDAAVEMLKSKTKDKKYWNHEITTTIEQLEQAFTDKVITDKEFESLLEVCSADALLVEKKKVKEEDE